MYTADYSSLDEALETLSPYGPDLSNGLTSHAPMAAEALCAMGRSEAVMPWVERYRRGMLPRPPAREQIAAEHWRSARAQEHRFSDWSAFFENELHEASWRQVVNRWVGRLAPGICAAAAHGVIRVGHAARSLGESESPQRLRELADALASWAYAYQELPTNAAAPTRALRPRDAIAHVQVVPQERRVFTGTIVSSLEALREFPEFASVIGLIDVGGNGAEMVSELTDVFARIYLANAHDMLNTIVFIHGVTSVTALGNLLPHLDDATARAALRFAWQASSALYAAFGSQPAPAGIIEPPPEHAETLIDLAIAHGDEHAIKFTEVCLHQHARRPSPAYLAAARHAIGMLPPA